MKRISEIVPHSQIELISFTKTPLFLTRFALRSWLLFVFILLLMLFLPWMQTVRGRGSVIAYSANERFQSIDAPVYGLLGKWHVQDGTSVKKGDVIIELLDTDPNLLKRYEVKKSASQMRLGATRLSVEMGRRNLKRQEQLFAKGISSKRQVELARVELAKYQSEESKAVEELNKIEIKLNRQKMQMVRAPMDGIIRTRMAGYGSQFVKKGESLAQLVPHSSHLAVELWIDANDLPFLELNAPVRVQFEGWPAIQSYGWPSLAYGTFGGRVNVIDPFVSETGKVRLLVVPDPQEAPWPETRHIRQGLQVYAWVMLNKVSLGFEIWRLFNGFPPYIPEAVDAQKKSKSDK